MRCSRAERPMLSKRNRADKLRRFQQPFKASTQNPPPNCRVSLLRLFISCNIVQSFMELSDKVELVVWPDVCDDQLPSRRQWVGKDSWETWQTGECEAPALRNRGIKRHTKSSQVPTLSLFLSGRRHTAYECFPLNKASWRFLFLSFQS